MLILTEAIASSPIFDKVPSTAGSDNNFLSNSDFKVNLQSCPLLCAEINS